MKDMHKVSYVHLACWATLTVGIVQCLMANVYPVLPRFAHLLVLLASSFMAGYSYGGLNSAVKMWFAAALASGIVMYVLLLTPLALMPEQASILRLTLPGWAIVKVLNLVNFIYLALSMFGVVIGGMLGE